LCAKVFEMLRERVCHRGPPGGNARAVILPEFLQGQEV